jgi:hypothetical protein
MRPAGALALAIVFSLASGARAQSLADADRAYRTGRFEQAARGYEQAIAAGSLEPSDLVRAHEQLALVAVLNGDAARAEESFAIVLALDPARPAPAELPPEWRERFEAWRTERGGRRLTLSLERAADAFVLGVHDAPDALARTIEVRGEGHFRQRLAWDGQPLRIEPPPTALPLSAVVLDAHGNRLARAGVRPIAAASITQPATQVAGRSLLESPWLWIAVALVVIGASVAIGVSASGDRYILGPPVIR